MLERGVVVGLGALLIILGVFDVHVQVGAIVAGVILVAAGTFAGVVDLLRRLTRR